MLAAPRRIEVEEVELGDLLPGHVRIRVEGCGVCGSNLPLWEGRPWFTYPLPPGAPGHEGWGLVDAVGDDVDSVRLGPGTRCAFLHDLAFAEFVDVDQYHVLALPPELEHVHFPGEALGCGFNVVERSCIETDMDVCVVGIGYLGALVTAISAARGARVIAVGRRQFALDVATKMGAAEVVPLVPRNSEHEIFDQAEEEVASLTGGGMCDVVVEAVGAQGPLDLASRLTKLRGRLVIAGFHQDGTRSVDLQAWNWRGLDVINAHERDAAVRLGGMEKAAAAIASGWFDPLPLHTHEFPLERAGEAMELLATRPVGFMKALVLL